VWRAGAMAGVSVVTERQKVPFEKNEPKKFHAPSDTGRTSTRQLIKVFCFFFSKKKSFLPFPFLVR
jgi:hypothetical protein